MGAALARFKTAMLGLLSRDEARNWQSLRASVTGTFRVIDPNDIRVLTWRGYSLSFWVFLVPVAGVEPATY